MAWRRLLLGAWVTWLAAVVAGGCSSDSSLPAGSRDGGVVDAAATADGPAAPVPDAAVTPAPDGATADGGTPADGAPGDGAPGDGAAADTGDGPLKMVMALQIRPMDPHMRTGERLPLILTATFTDSSSAEVGAQATWTSSDMSVATVDKLGQVSALAGGTVGIKAAYLGKEASVTITVRMVTPSLLMLSPTQLSLDVADMANLSAVLAFDDGSSKDVTPEATWRSSDPGVAAVDGSGVVTARGPGTAAVTATYLALSATAGISVTNAALVALVISQPNLTVPAGQTRALSLTAELADGTRRNVSTRATWTSSNTGVASVSSGTAGGLVMGVAAGSATVTAGYGGLTASATVTVP